MPRAAARASRCWFVYMLECRGNRIYTGISPDVAARFAKHRAGHGGAFTRAHAPTRILGVMRCGSRSEALKAEYALKQLAPRAKRRWARQWRWRTRSPGRASNPASSPRLGKEDAAETI